MYKKLFFVLSVLSASAFVACDGKKPSEPAVVTLEADTTEVSALDWESADRPMFLMSIGDTLIYVFDSDTDSLDYLPYADRYTTLIDDGKSYRIAYSEVHHAPSIGNLIGGDYSKYMSGLYYKLKGGTTDGHSGFGFTDAFMAEHQSLPFRSFSEDAKVPARVLQLAQQQYAGTIEHSWCCAESTDGSIGIYRLQYQPVDTVCMGLTLVLDGDSVYTFQEPAYHYEDSFTWHVDDDGIFGPVSVFAITRGPKGLDIFCVDYACESVTPFVIMARDGQLQEYDFACYYVYMDYHPEPIAEPLPATASLTDEYAGYRVWVDEERAPTESDLAGLYKVYYSCPESNDCFLVASNLHGEGLQMQYPWPPYVDKDQLLSCSDAHFVCDPKGDVYLVMGGCPDARNDFTYIIGLPLWGDDQMIRWIPTNNGFCGLDASGELLKLANYGYNDDGRYAVYQYYNFNIELVREEPYEE